MRMRENRCFTVFMYLKGCQVMDVSYGLKEFDQILEGLECLVMDF